MVSAAYPGGEVGKQWRGILVLLLAMWTLSPVRAADPTLSIGTEMGLFVQVIDSREPRRATDGRLFFRRTDAEFVYPEVRFADRTVALPRWKKSDYRALIRRIPISAVFENRSNPHPTDDELMLETKSGLWAKAWLNRFVIDLSTPRSKLYWRVGYYDVALGSEETGTRHATGIIFRRIPLNQIERRILPVPRDFAWASASSPRFGYFLDPSDHPPIAVSVVGHAHRPHLGALVAVRGRLENPELPLTSPFLVRTPLLRIALPEKAAKLRETESAETVAEVERELSVFALDPIGEIEWDRGQPNSVADRYRSLREKIVSEDAFDLRNYPPGRAPDRDCRNLLKHYW